MRTKPLVASVLALSFSSGASFALDYNDAYWSTPNSNADFVDQFSSSSINRNVWKVESDIFVNGEDQDYQDVEYPAADWTLRSGQPDAGIAIGAEGFGQIVRQAGGRPCVAIGGIQPSDVRAVLEAGGAGVAVVSSSLSAPDIMAAARTFAQALA